MNQTIIGPNVVLILMNGPEHGDMFLINRVNDQLIINGRCDGMSYSNDKVGFFNLES